ncbi:hypothetical protein [Paraurantiacibacter namhicola]|uniref:Uncharacterized protein n=1 Tax=Paraurantiacibacter namhicola TaxID=645517 RepID=A0A1C7D6I2_9SPHN|nr:hypothetical protein [Paraurantiacibacter namhicola]ANU07065.1 hypothetical protein A6F65_00745 [Paraurantiacibacter namhicola]
MSTLAALLLAMQAAPAPQADVPVRSEPAVASARIGVAIVRPAAIRGGKAEGETAQQARRTESGGRILFEFE